MRVRWIVSLVVLLWGASCGAAGGHKPPDTVSLSRFEPDVFAADGGRAFRILGRGFGLRGDVVRVVFTARDGTPFCGGSEAALEAEGIIDSEVQIRGHIPDPLIPRQFAALQEASIEVFLPDGGHAAGGDLRGVFEPTRLTLTGTQPALLDGVSGLQAALIGAGFDPLGGRAVIRFTARHGVPFDGHASADVTGTVVSPSRIQFDAPRVGPADFGRHDVDVHVTLVDSDGAGVANEGWTGILFGPPPPAPFQVSAIVPWQFSSKRPVVFLVRGTAFTPLGATATVRFIASAGTPFRGGTSATLDVPVLIESEDCLRGLSPRVPDLASAQSASVTVILPDTREVALPPDSVVFRPHQGAPRLVINEVDYDQIGSDAAEFVELHNAGDGDAQLGQYALEFVNGAAGAAVSYRSFQLDGTLGPGAYFVLSTNAATVANTDLDVAPDTNLIQNGAPDAIALIRNGKIIDALSYEGDVSLPYREGSGSALVDAGSGGQETSLARWFDGLDSDNNNVDFETSPPTPGAPNIGPGEPPFAATLDGATNPGHLLSFHPTSGRGFSRGPIETAGGVGGLDVTSDGGLVATDREVGTSDLLYIRRDGSTIWNVGTIVAVGAPLLVADLSVHPSSGVIYALDDAAIPGGLFTVDPVSAVATRVGDTPLVAGEQNGGLAFAPDGTLYMTTRSEQPRLVTLDPASATQRTAVALELTDTVTLAVRTYDGALYTARLGDGGLFVVNTDGTVRSLGFTAAGSPGAIAFE